MVILGDFNCSHFILEDTCDLKCSPLLNFLNLTSFKHFNLRPVFHDTSPLVYEDSLHPAVIVDFVVYGSLPNIDWSFLNKSGDIDSA